MMRYQRYGPIQLLDIRAQKPESWEPGNATHMRVVLPAVSDYAVTMQRRGFVLADRTLGVSVNLLRSKLDFERLIRLEVAEEPVHPETLLAIASVSFPDDRRFHITPDPDRQIAELILADWVRQLETVLVCRYKGQPIGFLALRENAPDSRFVHLAAVLEQYRTTGAALSLYAKAAALCKTQGVKRLEGRISTKNAAVMNLYAFLGAVFGEPEDVYLKEVMDQ